MENNLTLKLDNLDRKIINLLQEDSRLSFNKIANKLGISAGTAFNRIKNLENKKIIKAYTVLADTVKAGYNLTAVILIQADGKHLPELEDEIAKQNNVISVYDITGDYDIAIVAKFKNRSNLNTFIKNLLIMPYAKRTITNVVLNVIKEDFRVKV